MSIKLSDSNVYAHIMLSEDLYTPKIELKSDMETLSSFIVQAISDKNYGVRLVDLLDRHICDVELVNMEIFRELRFYNSMNTKDLCLRANNLFDKYINDSSVELPKCEIENVDYWCDFIENATDEVIKKDFNKRVFSNFKCSK